MRGHTPGPWSVFDASGTIAIDVGPKATGRRPNIVDWTGFDSNDQSRETNLANARLIAAAPDMLEALEHVRALITEGALTGFNPNDGTWATRLFDSQAMSAAAVRKAGGDIRTKGGAA